MQREIRAQYTSDSITVYQAYPLEIAAPALKAGTFVPPFKFDRMTWIKPSFLWMMYRCGWASKPNQERVLRITITREGFEWALSRSCLSGFDPEVYSDRERWRSTLKESPVRIQWDPDRDVHLAPQPHRAIQIGLSGESVGKYVNEWITSVEDVTPLAKRIHKAVAGNDVGLATEMLPSEKVYPLSARLRAVIGASST